MFDLMPCTAVYGNVCHMASHISDVDAVADRDDHVEVVEPNRLVGVRNVQILHIAFFVQLALVKHIANVFGDDGAFTPEELGHLLLGQPNGVVVQPNFDNSAGALVNGNGVHGGSPSRRNTKHESLIN